MDRASLSLGLSAIALLLAGYVAVRGAAREPPPQPSSSAQPSAPAATAEPAVRSDFEARLLQSLERRLTALEAKGTPPADSPAAAPSAVAVSSSAPLTADGSPRFVRFDVGRSNVSVTQDEAGAIAVTNRDPTLTGKTLIVRGFAADGSETAMTVTVPPP